MAQTLIILNPHAGSGQAGRVWQELEPLLWDRLGELVVVVTQRSNEVARHLEEAYSVGINRVIAIGGDGTNHSLINAVIELNERHPDNTPMIYGNIPIGTGRDWARGLNIPTGNMPKMADWIARAQPQPTDIGMLNFKTDANTSQREYFLNIASAGMGGDVSERVNNVANRRSWTFLRATVETLISYTPQSVRVWLDGEEWYEGGAFAIAIANGTTFGHGMKIAPEAVIHDGLFDVVMIKAYPRLAILSALKQVYDGTHLTHPCVKYGHAKEVLIRPISADGMKLELDGEFARGSELHFSVRPNFLQILT